MNTMFGPTTNLLQALSRPVEKPSLPNSSAAILLGAAVPHLLKVRRHHVLVVDHTITILFQTVCRFHASADATTGANQGPDRSHDRYYGSRRVPVGHII